MEVDAISLGLQQTIFLMAGGVSVEDRSRRPETVIPQHDGHCERRFVCDSALSLKWDGNDIELNNETDDEAHGGRRDGIRRRECAGWKHS